MICLAGTSSISAEARALIDSHPFTRDAMRQLAALLPSDDAELHAWFESAYAAHEAETFFTLWGAACVAERTLSPALLTPAFLSRCGALQVAWAAWRMKGEVTSELLRTLDAVPHESEVEALFVFVAAAQWLENRPGEEMPREIAHRANLLSREKKLSVHGVAYLQALIARLGLWTLARVSPNSPGAMQTRKQLTWLLNILNGPFDRFLREQAVNIYQERLPQRRAVEKIGPNAKCPCASGKKYKKCCAEKDRKRSSDSSWVPGMTRAEITQEQNGLITRERMSGVKSTDLVRLDPKRVAPEAQDQFIFTLSLLGNFDAALAALETYGISEHLQSAWSVMFEHALGAWRPDVARRLLEIFPDAEEKLGVAAHPGIKLLLVGDDPLRLFETLDAELRLQLESGNLEDLRRIVVTILASPYRSLGIFLTRSLLPIAGENFVPGIFESLLEARAKLNLSPDDAFSDFMDERALRAAGDHDSAELEEAKGKLVTAREEERRAKEEQAQLKRKVRLLEQQERRAEERSRNSTSGNVTHDEEIKELKRKLDNLSADLTERSKEKLELRRDTEKLTRENEALRAAQNDTPAERRGYNIQDADEELTFDGNQPVRLIDFPKDFAETLAKFPAHASRAVMKRIGLIAAGDKAGFDKIKQLKAYPGVLRARVSDKYRLFFTLTPDRVRIVDLIWRDDLERWVKQLLARGISL